MFENWSDAAKLPTKVLGGLLAACVLTLLLDFFGVVVLVEIHQIARPITIILAVSFGCLTVANLLAKLYESKTAATRRTGMRERLEFRAELARRKAIQEAELKAEADKKAAVAAETEKERKQREVLVRLDYLSASELRYLANALRENSQSFKTWVHSSDAGTLGTKGLVYTDGGTYHGDHYPFTIQDFVWRELLARKQEFLDRDEKNLRQEHDEQRARQLRR